MLAAGDAVDPAALSLELADLLLPASAVAPHSAGLAVGHRAAVGARLRCAVLCRRQPLDAPSPNDCTGRAWCAPTNGSTASSERGALYRSSYYNDWMRPQDLKYTIGNTLLAEGGVVANITLMRPPDMPTFGAQEVHAFESLSRHMTRALQMGLRLERPDTCPTSVAAFDAMPHAVAAGRRAAAPALRQWRDAGAAAARRRAVAAAGRVACSSSHATAASAALVADALTAAKAAGPPVAPLRMQDGELRPSDPACDGDRRRAGDSAAGSVDGVLTASEPAGGRAADRSAIGQQYGCTRSERGWRSSSPKAARCTRRPRRCASPMARRAPT